MLGKTTFLNGGLIYMNSAVMRAQNYAVSMEHDMRRVFKCERFGFAEIVNSDFIRRNPLAAVLATCGYIYASVGKKEKKQVEDFINETRFYWKMSFDELLSFETSSKTIDIATIELDYENGEQALKHNLDKFSELCKMLE